MIIFILMCIGFILLCGCMFGTVIGVPLAIVSIIGVVAYSCYVAKKDAEKSAIVPKLKPDSKPEPFCSPVTTDDLLATYCADKVVNKRFKI